MHPGLATLRPAQPSDAAALSDLALRSKAHWGYDQAFLDAVRDELAIMPQWCDGVRVVVAQQGSTLLGFYRLGFDPSGGDPPAGELADLFVRPDAIGTGVGGHLYDMRERRRATSARPPLVIGRDGPTIDRCSRGWTTIG